MLLDARIYAGIGAVTVGAIYLHQAWRKHAIEVAMGFIPAEDNFRLFISLGDIFLLVIVNWLLFLAVSRIPPGRTHRILKTLALAELTLFIIWKTCTNYLLASAAM